ncbi:sensor domain-containing diguanylate cyclase [Pseudomonas sp. P7]|uniref:sensor domain-containing diguanylate cyclase n=1 Tax=Pseudomonas sivasensis TaxID=1880678 RepID=UPI0015EC0616|nr:sensor domain-containing diguanylate cyclase [Pseudomonas sivasensis]MBA2922997.1 sensor domain-containing diguanylate cyclase [Pseudomonas sivasensis]
MGVSFYLALILTTVMVSVSLYDQALTNGYAELAVVIQALILGVLFFSTRRQQKQSKMQLNELVERKKQIGSLNERLTNLINAATQVAVITTDSQGQIKLFSQGAEALFGFTREEMLGRNNVEMLYIKEDIDSRRASCVPAFQALTDKQLIGQLAFDDTGSKKAMEWRYQRKDGTQFTGELRHARFSDPLSNEVEHISVIIDISERIELLDRINESKAMLTQLTQRIPNVLYQYHLLAPGNGFFTFCSDSIEEILELKAEAVVGANFNDNPLFERIHPDDLPLIRLATARSAETGVGWTEDFRMLLPVKGLRWFRVASYAERQSDQTCVWYGSFSDITVLKDREEKLRNQAVTDELTGIYNRRYFMSSLEQLVQHGKRYTVGFSLIMLDLDHFKSINDRFGHEVGDTVLKQTCKVIRKRLRASDVFCRIGGEELAILCPLTSLENAEELANLLCHLLANHEVDVAGSVTASFGVATWTADLSTEELLRRADQASYNAKNMGRNRVVTA